MENHVFDAFRRLAYEEAGIALRANKEALLSARIAKRVRSLGLQGEQQYLEYLRADDSGTEMFEFLDAISTNFTSFFRESTHFEQLARHVEEQIDSGARRLRVWCAAAATGEEPYTLAMTLSEVIGERQVDFKILASDISIHALRHASRGEYERERMAQVPAALRSRYFAPSPTDRDLLVAKPTLRDRIVWKRINLAQPPFPMRAGLDVIFCRNVMIYFDNAVRQRLVSEIERLLRPGGLLVVAHSETLTAVQTELEVVRPSVYQKRST